MVIHRLFGACNTAVRILLSERSSPSHARGFLQWQNMPGASGLVPAPITLYEVAGDLEPTTTAAVRRRSVIY